MDCTWLTRLSPRENVDFPRLPSYCISPCINLHALGRGIQPFCLFLLLLWTRLGLGQRHSGGGIDGKQSKCEPGRLTPWIRSHRCYQSSI